MWKQERAKLTQANILNGSEAVNINFCSVLHDCTVVLGTYQCTSAQWLLSSYDIFCESAATAKLVLPERRQAMSSTSWTVCMRFALLTEPVDLLLLATLLTELGLLRCLNPEFCLVPSSGSDCLISSPLLSVKPSSATLTCCFKRQLGALPLLMLSAVLPALLTRSASNGPARPCAVRCCAETVSHPEEADACCLAVFACMAASAAAKSAPNFVLRAWPGGVASGCCSNELCLLRSSSALTERGGVEHGIIIARIR